MAIKLPKDTTTSISVRLKDEMISDIDNVVKILNELTGGKLSRNMMLELLLQYAGDNASFEIKEGEEKTFKELLEIYNEKNK